MPPKKCDWYGCSEIGSFDGLDKKLLTEEGKRHIFAFLKLIFLCPYHFKVGVGAAAKMGDGRTVSTPLKTPAIRND